MPKPIPAGTTPAQCLPFVRAATKATKEGYEASIAALKDGHRQAMRDTFRYYRYALVFTVTILLSEPVLRFMGWHG